MPVRAYVFIRTLKGNAAAVAKGLSRIKNVKSAKVVSGRYDVVALVEAETIEELGNLVLKRVQRVRGVQSTETAIIAE
ncbi:MAG: Lrp/AsnC ligand binding domain-containing protein [Nitrososphaerota archaeon]